MVNSLTSKRKTQQFYKIQVWHVLTDTDCNYDKISGWGWAQFVRCLQATSYGYTGQEIGLSPRGVRNLHPWNPKICGGRNAQWVICEFASRLRENSLPSAGNFWCYSLQATKLLYPSNHIWYVMYVWSQNLLLAIAQRTGSTWLICWKRIEWIKLTLAVGRDLSPDFGVTCTKNCTKLYAGHEQKIHRIAVRRYIGSKCANLSLGHPVCLIKQSIIDHCSENRTN